jgi:hypothetical protein
MRSIREAESEVERLRAAWKDWQGALDVDSLLARQLLRKVLDGPIRVFPAGKGRWEFKGESRFDGLFGSIGRREHVGIGTGIDPRSSAAGRSAWAAGPIAGGCDPLDGRVVCGADGVPDMARHTPQPLVTPRWSRGAPRRGVLPEDRA